MPKLLLTTKLYIPPVRPELVPRPRLIERLNAGLHRKLTLISAPAGFGKTTLLSEWVHCMGAGTAPRHIAWLSLDEGDNDLIRFLTYLVAALQTIEANIGKGALGALQSPQPPPTESVLATLINEIAALSDRIVLVLDDYHLIEAQPIHQALTFLLEHLPPQMHLVIATRADPPLPIARLRGRDKLTELRTADLRFTPDEATVFLNQVMGLNLSAEAVLALEVRTEGWIAGLQLAASSLQGQKDTASFIQAFTGSHRYVLDYLVEEVLQRQSEQAQVFLLQTAILDRLTGSLCDSVSGQEDGQATLERLERDNLFIVPLDNERRWYRYHRLFADLLRARLNQAQPDQVPDLHRRASDWYEQNGFMAEAVGHALAAEDLERAARLVEGNALQMLMRGELTTLLGWLAALPDELIRARPWLCIHHAWALTLTGQLDAVEPRLQDAERIVQPNVPAIETQDMLGHVAAIRAYVAAHTENASRAIELARLALERLPEEDLVVRSVVAYTLGGVSLLSGNTAEASRAFAEAGVIGQAAGNIHLAVPAICSLAGLQAEQGQLHQAAKTYRDALQLTERGGMPLPVAAMAYSGMGELLYQWNDLEAAARRLMEGIELGKQWGNVDTLVSGYVRLARVLQAQGDVDGALDTLHKMDQLVLKHTVTPTMAAQVSTCWPWLWLAQGNIAAVSRWAQESGLTADDDPSYLREAEHIILARVLIAQGKPGEAMRLLTQMLNVAEAAGRMGRVIEILVLQAIALQSQGDTAQAMTSLEQALSLAEPEGYVRLFVDKGPAMEELLRRALSRSVAPSYVSKLLAPFGEVAAPVAQPLVEPLSGRELEVLRLVSAGLSNQEIAQELVIAVSTVKSHANHIFGKLGVKNRTQAAAQAKALELL